MDALVGFGVLVGLAVLIVPFVALGMALNARKRLRVLEDEVEARKVELRYLYDRLEADKKDRERAQARAAATPRVNPTQRAAEDAAAHAASVGANAAAQAAAAAAAAAIAAARELRGEAPDTATERSAPAELPDVDAGLGASATDRATDNVDESADTGPARPATDAGAKAEADARAQAGAHPHTDQRTPDPAAGSPKRARPRPPSTPPAPQIPFEQRLATWFTRIGAGALLLGVLYFYKYAVDNDWIGPAGRVALGALVGVVVLAIAEWVRPKTKPAFVHALVGVGLAFLYITAYASSAFYHLVNTSMAFGANVVILLLGAALAWRHRGEAVLVLVLIAGFANPVLLSTGEDRPFALFTYLLVLTSVTLYVSAKQRFRISLWLAVAGVAVLFAGWYDKFFEVFDHRGEAWAGDRPPSELVGAYLELGARVVPLVYLGLFTAQWIGTAFLLRREDEVNAHAPSRSVKPLAVAALLLSHAGAAALLYDHVRTLGGVMIVLAVVAVLVLRALDATRFLLVPMLAAFALLASLTADQHDRDHLLLLGLLGLWSTVYVVAFLKGVSDENREIAPADAVRVSVALLAFGVLATILLFPAERFYALGVVLSALAAIFAVLVGRSKVAALGLVALVLAFFPWIAAAVAIPGRGDYVNYPFLALAALWWGVYAVSITRDALSGRERRWVALLTLALSGLAFLAIALASTREETPTLRALLTAFVGAVNLALATILSRGGKALGAWVGILAALALGLFAPAVAFGLSGATITVAWALLALVAMFILAESREQVWLLVVFILLSITLFRVLGVDLEGVDQALREFEASYGRSGVMSVRAFFNPRGYALFSTGVVCLAGAFVLGRAAKREVEGALSPKILLGTAPVLATLGYALLTVMLVVETRAALLHLPPPPPMPLDAEEFAIFMQSVNEARIAHHNLLAMATTVILALVAMALLGVGFAAKDPFHRYLGLTLFLGTVGKLVFWDVWNLPRLYQVVVLTVVGVLLLGSGFLYARLKALFKGDLGAAAGVLLLVFATQPAQAAEPGAPAKAPAVKVGRYQHAAQITGVDDGGFYQLVVDAELYRRSAAESFLADVRIADAEGREVPFVVRDVPAARLSTAVPGQLLDPGQAPDGSWRATFELPDGTKHCQVNLQLSQPGAFLRRTRVEVAAKPNDFQTAAEGGLVYAVFFEGQRADSAQLRYPTSVARYVRVTLLPDREGPTVEIQGASFGCLEPEMIAPRERLPLTIVEKKQDAEKKQTVVELDAGGEGVPLDRLHLRITTPELQRNVRVLASSYKTAWPAVGSGLVYRTGGEGPESTAIAIRETRKRWLRLEIQDGDDAPLDLSAVEGSFPARQVIFRARGAGPHTLYVGDKEGRMASYDLAEIIARRPEGVDPKPATLGALTPNPGFGKDEVAPELPVTERYRGVIGVALSVVVLALALWAVRLLRR